MMLRLPVTIALLTVALLTFALLTVALSGCRSGEESVAVDEWTAEKKLRLAKCLTEKGWVMYGTSTCSGCRAQRKTFGDAFASIEYVECDPYEPNSQPERCLERNVRKTPVWILEIDGEEVKRLEMYQLLEDLAAVADCDFADEDEQTSDAFGE